METINVMIKLKIKEYAYAIIAIVALTGAILFFYETGTKTLSGLFNRDDYVYYDPKLIPALLLIPAMFFFDLLAICVFLPSREKLAPFLQRLMIPVGIYSGIALILGLIFSMVISIYPLSTDYYQCSSTSIVSSGSHYAKTKELCEEHAYHPTTNETQTIILPERNELEPIAQ